MSTFGIDGLSSGLDTTSIINQLMQLERQPAVRLEARISSNTRAKTAIAALSTSFAAIDAAAKALTQTTTSFVPRVASSNGAHVTAAATGGASLGSTTFSVERLAGSHRLITASTVVDATSVVSAAGTSLTLTAAGGTTTTVAIAAGATLGDVANAITAAGAGITAQVVNTGGGLKLQLSTATSGAGGVFTADLSGLDAGAFAGGDTTTAVLVQGRDAQVRVGDVGAPGSYLATSATNTFSDVLPGVTFTVSAAKPGEQVSVAVSEDPAAVATKVKAFVDAVNTALAALDRETDSGLKGFKGALAGDGTMRQLRDRLLGSVTAGVAGSTLVTGGLAGVQSTREGRLTFDEAAFTKALAADPGAVEDLFRSGDPAAPAIADRVAALAGDATRRSTGILAAATAARDSANRTFSDQVAAIDRRVELRRATLQRQFSGLEVALGRMQAQQSWLAGQLGALSANAPR